MKTNMSFHLLTVTGKVIPASVEATRELHNQTAGNPEGVAAAKHFGDLSHLTFMPLDAATGFKGELLFMDIWNDAEGMQTFFSDKQVQAGAALMFASREAVAWNKLDSFLNFNLPAPHGKNERIVGMVRGLVKSLDEAAEIHNASIAKTVKAARAGGIISHEFYVRMAAPGSPEALEVLGVDTWMDGEGMMKHYMSPEFQSSGLYAMFTSKASSSTWKHPAGEWVEW